jgi:hypothetical protein
VQARPIRAAGDSGADAGNESDDSALNDEEERLLDRLMANQVAGGFVSQTPPGFVPMTPKGTPGTTPRYS